MLSSQPTRRPPKWNRPFYPGRSSSPPYQMLTSSNYATGSVRLDTSARSGNKLSNLTFYDIKSAWTQAKNYALNISEIEAKVNEATSDDPWGASSTLMQEIAAATNNFQDFNEIMPCIFRNFMEREAREWRQIYKSLQLLEYIVKHGSERVVDDARSHLGTIKILRNFHYIDEAGKDQGLNVRNRAKELSEMLSDVERIRQERRKARSNKQKYQGVSNSDFVPGSGGGRYGGFGSDSYNAGGGAGGSNYGGNSSAARESFDEYDAGDDESGARSSTASAGSQVRRGGSSRISSTSRGSATAAPSTPSKSKKKESQAKVADLFSFDDDEPAAAPASTTATAGAVDDFDDFVAAPSSVAPAAPKAPAAAPAKSNSNAPKGGDLFDFLGDDSSSSQTTAAPPSNGGMLRPGGGMQPSSSASSGMLKPTSSAAASRPASSAATTSAKPSGGLSGFDDLWSSSRGGASSSGGAGSGKKTMADLAKEQTGKGVWGSGTPSNGASGNAAPKKDLFDLL